MNPRVVAQLLVQFGLPLTQQLVAWAHENKEVVTPDDLATLAALASYRSADSLAAAGIKIVNDKVVPL